MNTKKFYCKMEEVPVLAGFIGESLKKYLSDFLTLSSDYTEEKVNAIFEKRDLCMELEQSNVNTHQLKKVTATLVQKEKDLRPILNRLEGYVKRAEKELDVTPYQFGISAVRNEISRGNDEGVISRARMLLNNITRNQTALAKAGLKPELTAELTTTVSEIDSLNNDQNYLENQRNSSTEANINDYNELWDMISEVCADARAIYRGINETKLKEFTIATLTKRINAEGKRTQEEEAQKTGEG